MRDLEALYGLEIPVLMVDGKKAAKYRVTEAELRRILAGRAGGAGGLEGRSGWTASPACPPALPALPARLLRRDDEVPAAVLLPAGLVLVGADRLFLALADDRDPVGRHAEADQIVLHRVGAARAEREVVLRAAARVAVAFDGDLRARPALHPVGVALQHRPRVVADRRLVEIEEHVAERLLRVQLLERLLREDLLLGQRRRRPRRRRRRWRRWRRRWWRWRGRPVAAAVAREPAAEPSCAQPASVERRAQRNNRHKTFEDESSSHSSWRVAAYKAIAQVSIRANATMRAMEHLLRATARAEARHFWFRGFRCFVTPLLVRRPPAGPDLRLLDCGCGTGNNLELLGRFGRAYGFDLTASACKSAAKPDARGWRAPR